MSFLNDGHPEFKSTLLIDISKMPTIKAKLRNFTDQEKIEIREKVKMIKEERGNFLANHPTGHRFLSRRKIL